MRNYVLIMACIPISCMGMESQPDTQKNKVRSLEMLAYEEFMKYEYEIATDPDDHTPFQMLLYPIARRHVKETDDMVTYLQAVSMYNLVGLEEQEQNIVNEIQKFKKEAERRDGVMKPGRVLRLAEAWDCASNCFNTNKIWNKVNGK